MTISRGLIAGLLFLAGCSGGGQPTNAGEPAMPTPVPSPAGGHNAFEKQDSAEVTVNEAAANR